MIIMIISLNTYRINNKSYHKIYFDYKIIVEHLFHYYSNKSAIYLKFIYKKNFVFVLQRFL